MTNEWVEAGAGETSLKVLQAMREEEHAMYVASLNSQIETNNAQADAANATKLLMERTSELHLYNEDKQAPTDEERRWRALGLLHRNQGQFFQDTDSVFRLANRIAEFAKTGEIPETKQTTVNVVANYQNRTGGYSD